MWRSKLLLTLFVSVSHVVLSTSSVDDDSESVEDTNGTDYTFDVLYRDYEPSDKEWKDFSGIVNATDGEELLNATELFQLTMLNGSQSAPNSHKEARPTKLHPKFLTKADFERASHLTPDELKGGLEAIYLHGEEYNETAILEWLRSQMKDGNDIISKEDIELMLEKHRLTNPDAPHVATVGNYRRWPRGRVPYIIDRRYSSYARANIAAAMAMYHKHTCIRFVQRRSTDRDYVHIVYNPYSGCSSMVGRQGGRQFLTLGGTCANTVGTPLHEMMHAVGFWHEQSRPDRDRYINILWNTIVEGMKFNYFKKSSREVLLQGIPYDYYSIMHYRLYGAFSIYRGTKTMQPLKRVDERRVGNGQTFSPSDIRKLNKLYNCGGTTEPTEEVTTSPVVDSNCKDEHIWCADWEKKGECKRNSAFMEGVCKKSCNKCPTVSNCEDLDNNCGYWGRTGGCTSHRQWMMSNCPATCGKCGKPTTESCADSHRYCSDWSRKGECRRNPAYMNTNCRRSCRRCSAGAAEGKKEVQPPVVTTSGSCQDLGRYCRDWSRKGECRRNPAYMNTNCRRSCNLCSSSVHRPTSSNCRDVGQYCADWSRKGECRRNAAYMRTYCRKSCRLC